MIDFNSRKIISTYFAKGSVHDFTLFKQSLKKAKLDTSIQILADSGYQGMGKYHTCCQIPFKKTKLCPLTEEQKQANRQLDKIRITVEHVIRALKIFKMLALRYRNRRKRFALRFNLIAAIYNKLII